MEENGDNSKGQDDDDYLPEDGGYDYLDDHVTGDYHTDDDDDDHATPIEDSGEQNENISSLVQDENFAAYHLSDGYYDDEDADSLVGVNEADEAVNLSDILAARDSSLTEDELWGLCRECCLVLEVVNCTPEMFQSLCITPDTVAFDNTGNVCFLDLGSDPEPLYLPPEFNHVTHNYKSHLYSLGMTLLYAAEYNVDPSQPEISSELRDLFGCMTAEVLSARPSLEDIINLCEEELVGKASQEVCVEIAQTFALPTPPPSDLTSVSLADVTASLANYLESQSNLIELSSEARTRDLHQPQEHSTPLHLHEPPPRSNAPPPSLPTEEEDMSIRRVHTGLPLPTGNCGVKPTPAARKYSRSSQDSSKDESVQKPPVPRKPNLSKVEKMKSTEKEGDTGGPNQSDNQKVLRGNSDVSERRDTYKDPLLSVAGNSCLESQLSRACEHQATKPRKTKGLTLGDILGLVERPLTEDEAWALCREGILALNRKHKHLPAYICPDTLLLREGGTISFKAIPEEKPLEVCYMAPEIQQKGHLSDKMCLFGLGVTLQCALRNHHSSPHGMELSTELEDILDKMMEEDPGKRVDLDEASEVCGEHEQVMGIPSTTLCQELYQEGFEIMADRMAFALPKDVPKKSASSNDLPNGSAFRSVQGGSLIKPASISSNLKSVSDVSEGKGHPGLPSQFISPATHFKPIILQQSMTPAPGVTEVAKQHQEEGAKDCQPNDKDKEVVKKLKELKKNLMKHRQPGKDDVDVKRSPKSQQSPRTNDAGSRRFMEDRNANNKSTSDTKSESGSTLESLLSEIQKQGTVPDTTSLASAIAQFLQGQMTHSSPNQVIQNTTQGSLQGQNIQGQTQGPLQGQDQRTSILFQGQNQIVSPTNVSMQNCATVPQLSNVNLSAQFQPQLAGQPLTVPHQYSGGLVPGYPLQVQLQQDPRTGFIQLVPTGIVTQPIGPLVAETNSRPNSHCDNRSVSSVKSPKPQQRYSDNSSADNSAILNSSFNSNRSRGGRTARDLIQKTASLRSQNNQGSPLPNLPAAPLAEAMWRSKSAYALNQVDRDRGEDSLQRQSLSIAPGHVYDDSVLPANSREQKRNSDVFYPQSSSHTLPHPRSRIAHPPSHPQSTPGRPVQYFTQPPRTRSQSSSPSPSKDSGVSGMNTGYKPPPPGSLMERLLSNINEKQQQKLGQVVHLLREEFAFDGYMENGVEDIAMAEYIASLGNLKLDTFASAVTEKYSDLYWGADLLFNLYDAANGVKGSRRLMRNNAKSLNHNSVSKRQSLPSKIPIPGLDDPNLSSSDESGHPHGSHNRASDIPFPQSRHHDKPSGRRTSSQTRSQHHNSSDTSDTEKEYEERRRRYRCKQPKSFSGHLKTSGYDTPSMEIHPLDKENNISPRLQMHISNGDHLLQTSTVQVAGVKDWEPPDIPKASHANNPNSLVKVEVTERPPPLQGRQNAWTSPAEGTGDDLSSTNMSLDRRRRKTTPEVSVNTPPSRQLSVPNNKSVLSPPEKPPRHTGIHSNRTDGHVQPGPLPMKAIHTDGSCSSHSSEVVEVVPRTSLPRNASQLSLTENSSSESRPRTRKGHVIFHCAMMDLFTSPELDKFRQEIDEDDPVGLLALLASVQQQLTMERKMRRKSQTFYTKLTESPKAIKGDHKNTVTQVSKDLDEMSQKVRHLEFCRTHVEMLQAELSGVHTSYLYSIATKAQVLLLKPRQDNPLLHFQHPKEPHSGYEIQSLHSGTPEGLMAYLFANTALRDGYLHQFFFCYRYFVRPVQLLSFLVTTYKSAAESRSQAVDVSRIQQRVMDLIYYWVEGYYTVDLERDLEATELLHAFLQLSNIAGLPNVKDLSELLSHCEDGNSIDLVSAKAEEDIHIYKINTSRKWSSLKNILGRGKSGSPRLTLFHERKTPVTRFDDGFLQVKSPRRVDTFTLLDYDPQTLAEQLTIMAQSIFQLTHPVHYLNSKAQGISVAMTLTGSKTPLMQRMGIQDQDQPVAHSLFVNKTMRETAVQLMVEHDQELSHWVAAEIVNCSNAKTQLTILSKFLYTAQICKEMRNYNTCLAILDGLENLIVKQLPAWRHLQGKCVSIMEELSAVRLFLRNDGMAITSDPNSHLVPTIPSVLLFLFHVQQQEIGSFQLANEMYKWSKIRAISKIVDQIRIFKDHLYGFEPDYDLQDDLQLRIREFGGQDIHQIAAQHHTNYQKMPSGGISGAFRKMKGKLHSK